MTSNSLSIKVERKASISSVRSREQLLELESAYFAHKMTSMKQRRTKIIATLCEAGASVDDIKELLLSGMNVIRVNMAYCNQKTFEMIMKNKTIVEKDQGCFIPVIMDLKGNTLRLGSLNTFGGEISLKKGDEFRISTNGKTEGSEDIISCDCAELGKLVKPGDKLLVDYGRNVLIVKRIEKESETSTYLREKHPTKYAKGLIINKLSFLRITSNESIGMSSNEEDDNKSDSDHEGEKKDSLLQLEKPSHSKESIEDKDKLQHEGEKKESPLKIEKISRRKFEHAFTKKKKEKDVIVCEAESDCVIQSAKPIFIHEKNHVHHQTVRSKSYLLQSEDSDPDDEEEASCINVKDIKDLNLASKLEVDSVAVTGVRCKQDVDEARFILGNKAHIKVFAKIQNNIAYDNFDEILEAADGIIISRNYLSLHIPVEKLFFKQKEMIRKCQVAGKPVTIVSQVLESMVLGLVPTASEINDISNLILDGIDAITLVTETTYGLHKKEAIETLSRICYDVEYNEIKAKQKQRKEIGNIQQLPIHFYESLPYDSPINAIPKFNQISRSISSTIAHCAIKAVYDLQASLIVAFTQTGSTALKLSKQRSPCPILAVTISERVARQVSLLASVTAVKVGSMFGKDGLTQRVMDIAKEKNWVKTGDYIVVTFGDIEGVSGTTNSLKVLKV